MSGSDFRLAVFSDIHGNLPALEAVLTDLRRRGGADALVAAGDLLTEGPYPQETYELLGEVGAYCILGNHDEYLLGRGYEYLQGRSYDPGPKIRVSNAWTQARLDPTVLPFLEAQPFSLRFGPDGLRPFSQKVCQELLVTHATPRSCHDRVLSPEVEYTTDPHYEASYGVEEAPLIVFGHFHQSYVLNMLDGRRLVNVASVSMPSDRKRLAAYSLFWWDNRRADWQIEQRRVEYNWERTAQAMQTCSMPQKDFMLSFFV